MTERATPKAFEARGPMLNVNEIFYSVQGESTYAGLPCVFVRLRGCHLRCHYCDTEYAFHEGERWSIERVLHEVEAIAGGKADLVEVTGGEPLLQRNVHPLMTALCDAGKTVLLETSGACDVSPCDPRVVRVMDLKTPGSGESSRNLWSNIEHLNERDEVKFVLTGREDYDWMRGVLDKHELSKRVGAVLVSAVNTVTPGPGSEVAGCAGMSITDLAEWVIADRLPVRVQTQLHKLIWDPTARGV
ncbi:MAG: radical SAM protein [Planctomycetota bacterium]